jgi:biotin operon repressor
MTENIREQLINETKTAYKEEKWEDLKRLVTKLRNSFRYSYEDIAKLLKTNRTALHKKVNNL